MSYSAGTSCVPSVFAGMTPDQLQAALTSAQTALIELRSGSQVTTVQYSQGEGSRSVTYSKARAGDLVQMITELQTCLGIRPARRVFRPGF